MQVWNVLHAARWKYRAQKSRQKSPSGHHRTILSGYIFAIKAHIDNRKKVVKQQYLLHTSSQYGELRPTNGWDRLTSLGRPCKFQRVSRLRSVTARHSSSGRQPNFAALNRGRHLCSAGRPSRWTLAHISSWYWFYNDVGGCFYHFLNKIELCWGATRCVILPNFNLFGAMFMCTITKQQNEEFWKYFRPQRENPVRSSFSIGQVA